MSSRLAYRNERFSGTRVISGVQARAALEEDLRRRCMSGMIARLDADSGLIRTSRLEWVRCASRHNGLIQYTPSTVTHIVATPIPQLLSRKHPLMSHSVVFTRVCPRLWLLRATSRHRSQHLCARCHSVANAPLPGGAGTRGRVSSGAVLLSPGGGEESSPAPSNETQNMNTTENLISTGCPATSAQPINNIIKPIKFPAQPQEWKIVSLRECPTPDNMQHCETPDQAAAYWKTHIPNHPYFNPE